ncbi:hypothetical protein [Roseiarcus sp.]|jgi:hypothetical protein|uniref:hypothetical protein n=1 Tax=Roseiarcus sp. TaxID=1969460 RepID=UPI003F9A0F17
MLDALRLCDVGRLDMCIVTKSGLPGKANDYARSLARAKLELVMSPPPESREGAA